MSNHRHTSHFTLIEVLIASMILCGLAVALFSYAFVVTDSWGQLQDRRNQLNEVMTIDRAIDAIIPNIIPFNWPDPEAETIEEIPILYAQENSLKCAYRHRLNDLDEGALRFCEIYVSDNGELTIQYSDRPYHNWSDAGDRTWSTVLADNIASIQFEYVDWDTDTSSDNWEDRMLWTDFWDNVDVERYDVPLGILITVTWQDGRTFTWFRRTMGNSYRERYGKWNPVDTETNTNTNSAPSNTGTETK